MNIEDAVSAVQQSAVNALFNGGLGIYFVVLLFIVVIWIFVKAVSDAWQDKMKETVKAHLVDGTAVFLALAYCVFSQRYVSMAAAGVVGAIWFYLRLKKPARAEWKMALLLAAIFAVSYAGEWYVQRRHAPAYIYVVLSFDNWGVGDKDILVESWVRFKKVQDELFAGASSVQLRPKSVEPRMFDMLHWPERTPEQVIRAMGGGVSGRAIVLRNDVTLSSVETNRLITIVSTPHELAKKQLLPLRVLDRQHGTINDVDHLALCVTVALVKVLQTVPDLRITQRDENDVMKQILKHYATFLVLRDKDAYAGLIAEVSKLELQDSPAPDSVASLLAQYKGPVVSDDSDESALARRSQLAKIRINRGRSGNSSALREPRSLVVEDP
jgi:hypothetical protein